MNLYLVRHAKSEKIEGLGLYDSGRPLSREGCDRAVKLGKQFSEIKFDMIVTSVAARAYQTAIIIAGMNKDKEITGEIEVVNQLYPDFKLHQIAMQLHYGPLRKYLADMRFTEQIGLIGKDAAWETRMQIEAMKGWAEIKNVMIVAHSLMINMVGLYFDKEFEKDQKYKKIRNLCLDTILGSAEALKIDTINPDVSEYIHL